MKKKAGRPRLPKGKANGVLFAAKLSRDLTKSISEVKERGQTNSKFLRDAATEKVQREKTKEFIESLIRDLKEGEAEIFQATIKADGLPDSTGIFYLGSHVAGQGHFQPSILKSLEKYPSQGASLIMSGRNERLRVKQIHRCLTCTKPSYELWFDVVPE